jgi:hypothetical protein
VPQRHVGVGRNEDVLDIACGTGNAALRAAQADGRTTALDLTPEPSTPVAFWRPRQAWRSTGLRTGCRVARRDAGVPAGVGAADAVRLGEEAFDFGAENFGPMVMMRPMLEQQGKWAELRERAIAIYETNGQAEYLVAIGRKLT